MNDVGIGNVIRPEFIAGGACALLASAMVLAASAASRAEPPKLPVPAIDQSAVAQRGYFYVGGKYTGEPGKDIMQGQVYVEVLAPKDVRRPYPLVLIHGAAQTATNWMGTPDGRKGWAEFLWSKATSST
jgi:triacylglycerol esterase/lipase EstA (alpha/beta hydrolase family)